MIFLWIGITSMQKLFSSFRSLAFRCSFFFPTDPPLSSSPQPHSFHQFHQFHQMLVLLHVWLNQCIRIKNDELKEIKHDAVSDVVNVCLLAGIAIVRWFNVIFHFPLPPPPIKWENTICLIEKWTSSDRIIWCYVPIWFDFCILLSLKLFILNTSKDNKSCGVLFYAIIFK